MSLDKLDDYLTSDPNDREICEHGRSKPCGQCVLERLDEMEQERRANRQTKS